MSGSIHAAAATGFERAAAEYEAGRAGYPPEAVDWLVRHCRLRPGCSAVELAAGTGKLTRLIAPFGARLIAIEPVAAMRDRLAREVPGIDARDGTAEAIPLADASADAVLAASAFHWFRPHEAATEIHRILRPGGRVGLIWNVRDESFDWMRRLTAIVDRHRADAPSYRSGRWREALDDSPLFTALAHLSVPHTHLLDLAGVRARVTSISFIASLEPTERETVVAEVDELLATAPDLRGRSEIAFPYRAETFWCERLPSA